MAGYFINVMAAATGIKVYTDCVNGSARGLKTGAGTITQPSPTTFVEFAFDESQWPVAA
jgi:hypothetical protein